MDREIHHVERPEPDRPSPAPDPEPRAPEPSSRERQAFISRTDAYCLSPAERATMTDIGRFRTIAIDDLKQYRYQGNRDEMREDLRSLQDQGLIQRRTIWTGGEGDRLTVFVLTKRGKDFLEREGKQSDQQLYAGFVKPAEVHHDAAIYRMYQAETRKIEQAGGRVQRVVLDFELKQKVYQPLAKARVKPNALSRQEYVRLQTEVASQNRLKVVHGKILLPDLRIEYYRPNGERAHVDLELATHHYRGSSMRAKAEAGFKMYAPGGASGHASAFDPEFTAEIFSI